MQKLTHLLIVMCLVICGNFRKRGRDSCEITRSRFATTDIVFVGKVMRLYVSRTDWKPYRGTVRVDKVLKGQRNLEGRRVMVGGIARNSWRMMTSCQQHGLRRYDVRIFLVTVPSFSANFVVVLSVFKKTEINLMHAKYYINSSIGKQSYLISCISFPAL